ncbi:hypothetical protein, partial [Paraburkholderia sp. BCC1885]|uniref:hypothetical protein n=1 Tax=Paraburkholderia sp. BCC1885 TaxID=2562669 RepID=UPI001C919FA2
MRTATPVLGVSAIHHAWEFVLNTCDTVLSLPPKNESLAEQVNSSKEKNDDKQGKAGTVHARVQAGSGTT